MPLEESESSLEDGSDESSSRCLRHFPFFVRFFFLALESDDNDSDESDDDGSGSVLLPSSCVSLCFGLSVDQVI